jgi:hypothetical protein
MMDIWIVAFIIATFAVFGICFAIPQVGGSKKSEPIPKVPMGNQSPPGEEEELVVHDDDIFFDEPSELDRYVPPSVKGVRIAFRQFSRELDTLLNEVEDTSSTGTYHRMKYEELSSFHNTTLKNYSRELSKGEMQEVSQKLERIEYLLEQKGSYRSFDAFSS